MSPADPPDVPQTGVYDTEYHAALEEGSRRSAEIVLPMVLDALDPKSLVDVGCGSGAWAKAASDWGTDDVLGIDGPWVAQETLRIPVENFVAADIGQPLGLGRRFDLALCLEAAEHLPESAAETLVGNLTALSPVILFSAALPGQGGEGHVNEALPSYWCRHFEAKGYTCLDVLRGRIWDIPQVEPWYRQNILLFVDRACLAQKPTFADPLKQKLRPILDLAHPELLAKHSKDAAEIKRLGEAWQELHDAHQHLGTCFENLEAEHAELKRKFDEIAWLPRLFLRTVSRLRGKR
ncbi:methyltransferase domain-containing protein [Marivita sp.]|uniref:class I SAM-dependent methyltransferase n=1 Tax=Marivita sp. TaxID=2003365 RepID=UPI0025C36E71|nr:methyltransferase domain-containing protein [Marivita sp.]